VNQPGGDHPPGLVRLPRRFGGLQRVVGLGEARVRIALVHDVVQMREHLPDRHRLAVERQVLRLLLQDEGERLVRVVAAIERPDVAARLRVVVPEVCGGLCKLCHGVPIVDQRVVSSR
jgi:hypothetical protein